MPRTIFMQKLHLCLNIQFNIMTFEKMII